MPAYQATDPDPVDQDEPPLPRSNAYGLTIAPNGDALVADAAGNDIVRVTPDGRRMDGGPVRPRGTVRQTTCRPSSAFRR